MKIAEAIIYLDDLRPTKTGECSVKIRITFNRKRKYFPTGVYLTPNDYEQIFKGKRRTTEQKEIFTKVNYFLNKAENIINKLPVFTYDIFEESFLEQRNVQNSVSFAFDKYIEQLKLENRVGTASSYECARNSLNEFNSNLSFADININQLKKYENWMISNGKSLTTIGIYLRSLRAIYNLQNIDKSLYPFGEAKNKYSIPTSRNIKKALTLEEIGRIYNYKAVPNSTKEMAKDYWLFLYLCNGMNVKDFCLLKWENIEQQTLYYTRAKTRRSKKESKKIIVALKSEALDIIKKWGVPSIQKSNYIFPHFQVGISAERELKICRQLTKQINKYLKLICNEVGIDKPVTTYFARHSFATVLKRSGSKIEMISELLGHSSVDVTENYLDSFENEQIHKETDVLTSGFRKIN
ncbi:MAG: tyrosine-type recombinase/integrase [Crocinitomicaceae bacterium]|jgi:integrase/recombinase XerD